MEISRVSHSLVHIHMMSSVALWYLSTRKIISLLLNPEQPIHLTSSSDRSVLAEQQTSTLPQQHSQRGSQPRTSVHN